MSGVPWITHNYTSSVTPTIFIVLSVSQVQKPVRKLVPEVTTNFFVPFFTVFTIMPLGFLFVEPVFIFATDILVARFETLLALLPVAYRTIVGFF